jgi:vacuolar-type H+-ATPase subunit E/Vma4
MSAMKAEINQIIEADDTARESVTQAQAEAAGIRAEAERQAEEIAASQKTRLTEAVAAQVREVLAEAQSRAQRTKTEADDYLERLHARREQVRVDLVDTLLKKVTGP